MIKRKRLSEKCSNETSQNTEKVRVNKSQIKEKPNKIIEFSPPYYRKKLKEYFLSIPFGTALLPVHACDIEYTKSDSKDPDTLRITILMSLTEAFNFNVQKSVLFYHIFIFKSYLDLIFTQIATSELEQIFAAIELIEQKQKKARKSAASNKASKKEITVKDESSKGEEVIQKESSTKEENIKTHTNEQKIKRLTYNALGAFETDFYEVTELIPQMEKMFKSNSIVLCAYPDTNYNFYALTIEERANLDKYLGPLVESKYSKARLINDPELIKNILK
jgi:hypothetical protein